MNDYMAYFDPDDHVRREAYDRAAMTVHQIVQRILLERRLMAPDQDDLLTEMMGWRATALRGDRPSPPLTDQIFTYLMAGHETTAKTLTWATYLLDRHRDVYRRLQDEVAAAGDWRSGDVVERLPYTWMVVQEALRLYPPVWLMSRRCVDGDELDGYEIPAGSLVIVSPYTLHRHPRYWPEPLRFRPERFDPLTGDVPLPYSYFPFSGGRRMCIGRRFAAVETVIVLASIAERFECRLEPGHAVVPEALVTLRPRHGLRMQILERR
jgi:cytochrome P450